MMALLAAWRKTWFNLTTGIFPDSIKSSKILPGPTLGNWSFSPTNKSWQVGEIAFSKEWARKRSTIELSSTMTASKGKGLSLSRLNPRLAGSNSSKRCKVFASKPAISPNLWAARPVGAAKPIFLPMPCQSATMVFWVKVFPVPGPPVRTITRDEAALITASSCCGESLMRLLWVYRCIQSLTRGKSILIGFSNCFSNNLAKFSSV